MSAATPEILRGLGFHEAMVELHTLIHKAQMEWLRGNTDEGVRIDNRVLEYIRNQVEWLTNITPEKEKEFIELVNRR